MRLPPITVFFTAAITVIDSFRLALSFLWKLAFVFLRLALSVLNMAEGFAGYHGKSCRTSGKVVLNMALSHLVSNGARAHIERCACSFRSM